MNNKMLKGILMIVIMIQVIALGLIPKEKVYALGNEKEVITEIYVNKEYSNVINNNIYDFAFKEYNYARLGAYAICNTLDEAAEYLRKQMVNREDEVVFILRQECSKASISEIFRRAIRDEENLNPNEGDYLLKHFTRYRCSIAWADNGAYKFTYRNEYLSTACQEEQVDNAVKEALEYLGIKRGSSLISRSEYYKVKAIHDYIVKNVHYDSTYKNYSAYNAIIDKSVVCQGFASLTYKMLKEAGIMTRIITGWDEKGNSHAWNIVRIDGEWYNLDTTWDENISTNDTVNYKYFLKSDDEFVKHYRDSEYLEEEFIENHPISNVSYEYFNNSNSNSNSSASNTGIVFPRTREDVNGDGVVDTQDLAMIANVYNIDSSSSKWNSNYDIIKDNIIDIYDIVALSGRMAS